MQVDQAGRMFDPEMGRFISRDPLGYVDGTSLYNGYFAESLGLDPNGTKAYKITCPVCPGLLNIIRYENNGKKDVAGVKVAMEFKPKGKMGGIGKGDCCCDEIRFINIGDIEPGKWQGRDDAYVDPFPNDDKKPFYLTDAETKVFKNKFGDLPSLNRNDYVIKGKMVHNYFETALVCVRKGKDDLLMGFVTWGYKFDANKANDKIDDMKFKNAPSDTFAKTLKKDFKTYTTSVCK